MCENTLSALYIVSQTGICSDQCFNRLIKIDPEKNPCQCQVCYCKQTIMKEKKKLAECLLNQELFITNKEKLLTLRNAYNNFFRNNCYVFISSKTKEINYVMLYALYETVDDLPENSNYPLKFPRYYYCDCESDDEE